jgi:tetratricopeptide (TPR) repeat protein
MRVVSQKGPFPEQEPILRNLLKSLLAPSGPRAGNGKLLRLRPPEPDYGRALERSARNLLQRQIALDRERAEARFLLPELLAHRPERQELLMRNDPRFQTWGMLELLLDRSRGEILENARECERLATLARILCGQLDGGYYGVSRIDDMRARAWSCIAESRRLRSDFAGAEAALASAYEHLRAGTGDTLERALILDIEAPLRCNQRRFAEAKRLLNQAIEIFIENGEDQRVGLSLVSLANVHLAEGNARRALSLLQEALRRIDGEREPRLLLTARHNLIDSLVAAGRCMEARGLLIRTRMLYRQCPDGWTQSHLCWIRGKVTLGFHQGADAESELLAAREGFLALGSLFEAGRVALDLATLYARQERASDLRRLAVEAQAELQACGADFEARAAASFVRQAEEIEGASQELARAAALE